MRSSSAMTVSASSMSRCSTTSIARSRVSDTRSSPPSDSSSSRWRSAAYCWRRCSGISAEPPADVVLSGLLRRVGEDLRGVVDLDQAAGIPALLEVEEGGEVARAARLLHVVGDDHDRIVGLQV